MVPLRDLKLDNTLLDGKTPGRVKLCDFGFAKQWEKDKNMFTHIGYAALVFYKSLGQGCTVSRSAGQSRPQS